MKLFTVVPEHVILVAILCFLAILFRAIPILILAVLYTLFLLYYTRGPNYISSNAKRYEWIAPCQGTIIQAQCTPIASHITWEHLETYEHGLYAPTQGSVVDIQKKKHQTHLTLKTVTGNVDILIHSTSLPARILVYKGDTIVQGQLLAFMPSKSHITLSTEIYDQEWYIQKDDYTKAGQVIGHVKQLWIL